ncbi:MAG: hypothetical protein R2824_02350 [Saprospiraceae bacterium]|nr:hypothetical protein [Lewinella sp.]
MFSNNKGASGKKDKNSDKPSMYDIASKKYDLFMEWAEETFLPLPYTPSSDYIIRKYKEHLKENNIDELWDPLPPATKSRESK